MTQTEAFKLIDEQLERDFKNCNVPIRATRQLIKAHTVLKKTLIRRQHAALKREHEERLLRGDL